MLAAKHPNAMMRTPTSLRALIRGGLITRDESDESEVDAASAAAFWVADDAPAPAPPAPSSAQGAAGGDDWADDLE